jgi:hypothetical protein
MVKDAYNLQASSSRLANAFIIFFFFFFSFFSDLNLHCPSQCQVGHHHQPARSDSHFHRSD